MFCFFNLGSRWESVVTALSRIYMGIYVYIHKYTYVCIYIYTSFLLTWGLMFFLQQKIHKTRKLCHVVINCHIDIIALSTIEWIVVNVKPYINIVAFRRVINKRYSLRCHSVLTFRLNTSQTYRNTWDDIIATLWQGAGKYFIHHYVQNCFNKTPSLFSADLVDGVLHVRYM
jgi:hypothetical protein